MQFSLQTGGLARSKSAGRFAPACAQTAEEVAQW